MPGPKVKVIASQFSAPDQCGDFTWMIKRPEYADTLFIFNDNEEQFRAFQKDQTPKTYGCQAGSNNAAIRPYQCDTPPQAAGVPTGTLNGGGYSKLTAETRGVIDEAFAIIKKVLASGRYQRVIYSAASSRGDLGTGVFVLGDDVKTYIVDELRKLET